RTCRLWGVHHGEIDMTMAHAIKEGEPLWHRNDKYRPARMAFVGVREGDDRAVGGGFHAGGGSLAALADAPASTSGIEVFAVLLFPGHLISCATDWMYGIDSSLLRASDAR